MALSPEDAAWLAELKAARKKLIKGEAIASISSGGRSLSVSAIPALDALKLIEAEIEKLEAADAGDGTSRRRGALTFAVKS